MAMNVYIFYTNLCIITDPLATKAQSEGMDRMRLREDEEKERAKRVRVCFDASYRFYHVRHTVQSKMCVVMLYTVTVPCCVCHRCCCSVDCYCYCCCCFLLHSIVLHFISSAEI